MKSIFDNADYKQAQTQLDQLQQAHAAALLEESALLAQMNAKPEGTQSALERAKAMLTGGTPAPRQDTSGLQRRLDACRDTLTLLGQAIAEQRTVIAGLVGAQSAIANSERKADHIKAVQGIKTALTGLRAALEAEQSIRAEIGAAGYLCTLEPIERLELNPRDIDCVLGQFARDVDGYLTRCDIESKKTATVHLLADCPAGRIGDVLVLSGSEAAALVHTGRAELSSAKPGRKPLAQQISEVIFS